MTAAGVTSSGSDRGIGSEPAGGSASIGSVLDALRADFPEITISKIRFLESEGLISPARTPSGYRQFSAADVARLRFVLSAQRDHYLPLKVIRAKLDEFDRAPTPGGPTLAGEPAALATAPPAPSAPAPSAPAPSAPAPSAPAPSAPAPSAPAGPAPSRPTGVAAAPALPGGGGGSGGGGPRDPYDPAGVTGGPAGGSRSAGPVPPVAAPPERSARPEGPGVLDGALDAAAIPAADAPGPDRAALLAVDGVDEALLEDLASHGILRADATGRYEPEALLVARTAAALSVLGVEPRLLRGLRAGAEREAGLLTQLVTPVARGRAPGASDRAAELTRELATLSGRLHTLLVAAGLRAARR